GGRTLRGPRHGDGRWLGILATAGSTSGIATVAQQNQFVTDHFSEILLLPILFVAACLQTALYIDLFALQQVVGDVLGPPENAVVPVSFFLPLAALLVFPAPAGG